jgi:Aspartyl protease
MTRLKFDYIKIGKHKRPIIPIQLSFGGKAVNTPALIDSGADFNLIHVGIAETLGIKLNKEKPIVFSGVGNKSLNLEGYMAVVNLKIFNKGENISFITPIIFTEQLPENGIALLGETGFFDHLEEVSFHYIRGKVVLQKV